jgi:peptidoglycan/xylan/chitin deacetylase (PgdA/CDA1 family)
MTTATSPGAGASRRLTLTFDNGPVPGTTERILQALDERGLPAIFFMVGERVLAAGGRETAARVRAAGHRIGNHTMSHGTPLGELGDAATAISEISGADAVLGDLTEPDRLFRPNGRGRLGPHVLSWPAIDELRSGGYTVVTWNCVPRDGEEPSDSWVGRAHAALQTQDWTVLVLHDHHPRAVDHLPAFLDRVRDAGIEVTPELPDSCVLLRAGRPQPALDALMGQRPRDPGR